MTQGHILALWFPLISVLSSLNDHIFFLSLFFCSLVFLWYNLSKRLGTMSYHSPPHYNSSPVKRPSGSVHDMFSVLMNPTTPPTTAAMTYVTPPSDVPRTDAASIPPRDRGQPLPLMNEQCRGVRVPQPYDAFLVLDVEATCLQGTDFDWPNEIIEWPVCLLKWVDKGADGMAGTLQKIAEFRSFAKPTWRPKLSPFCISLTGITQEQVDGAPNFPEVASRFSAFLVQHGLIHPRTSERLIRFCWCTDGPFDIRDFVVKQCYISNISMPPWIRGDVVDVRKVVGALSAFVGAHTSKLTIPRRISPNIEHQLRFLELGPFEGRQHSGIDDSRNIARIVIELARRGVRLVPNTPIQPGRRWPWMGRSGQVLEQYCLTPRH